MSEDYFIELLLKPLEFQFLKKCLLNIATNPLSLCGDKQLAGELYDQIKEQENE